MNILMINDCADVAKNLCDAINRYSNFQHHCHHVFTPLRQKSHLKHIWQYLKFCWSLRYKSKQFDYIVIHFARHGILSLFCQSKTLIYCHGDDVRNLTTYPFHIRLMVTIGLKQAVKIFYSTPDLNKQLIHYRHKTVFIPSPITMLTSVKYTKKSQQNNFNLMFISKLEYLKGMEILPDILPKLIANDKIKKITLLDFGVDQHKIPIEDHPKLEKLQPLQKTSFLKKIQECDIAIGQFSPYGGIGISELDAMNCTKPLICHFIFDSVYQNHPPFHRAKDISTLLRQIEHLLSLTPKQRYIHGKKNHQWVQENHSQAVIYKQFIRHFI